MELLVDDDMTLAFVLAKVGSDVCRLMLVERRGGGKSEEMIYARALAEVSEQRVKGPVICELGRVVET
jgi:hypothetical protein